MQVALQARHLYVCVVVVVVAVVVVVDADVVAVLAFWSLLF